MISCSLIDPNGEVSSVKVAYQSKDCVVIYVDLSARGKRAEVGGYSGATVDFGAAALTIKGLPFRKFRVSASSSRYTLTITYLRLSCYGRRSSLYEVK
jgi:hypothetical protein